MITNPKKTTIPRRTFIAQNAMLGGALIFPPAISNLFSSNESSRKPEGIIEKQILGQGWKIKSIDPARTLNPAMLIEAVEANEANGWLKLPWVPAMPHEILLHYKKIEEPWKPFGIEKCFWVSRKDWIYAVNFKSNKVNIESRLVFEEMRGTVDIYLNEIHIANHSDQTQPLFVDVTGKLKSENQLILHFTRPLFRGSELEKSTEGIDPSKRTALGNYLGPNPKLYTLGLVGDVILEHTDGSLISEIITGFSLNRSFTKGTVNFTISGKSRFKTLKVRIRLNSPDGQRVAETIKKVDAENGEFLITQQLTVANPELWWPRGYGEQKLYNAEISLLLQGDVHQKEYRTIGFRKIEMPETPFHFVVNGKPVFLRGGDWVTPDLLSYVWSQERVKKLFDLAEHANFNKFYELADARGFLLWQDFTRMKFHEEESIKTSVDKATKFLIRLKHHPSILLWCGVNESAMWWHEDYNKEFTDKGPWPGLVAANAVGEVCKKLDPDRHYVPSAPYGGVNANDPREGTTNGYTNMWYVPGYDYLNFASEDTRISCPTLRSMEKFMLPEEIFPEGYSTLFLSGNKYPYPETWLPYTASTSWKKTGPVEEFYDATDAASLVNRIGMAEGVYYRDVIERQRRGRPATEESDRRCCGGYLVWKYNESWPEIYSAKVDYFLEPYHVYYTLRAAYAPVILSFDIGTYIYLWVVNDSTKPVGGTVKIQLYHLEFYEFRKEIVREVNVLPGKSQVVVRLDQAGIRAFRKEHILFAELKDSNGNTIARTNALADIERRCNFPDAKLSVMVEDNALVISTDKFARNINLGGNADGDQFGWFFEDNYFDLLPGEKKVVRVLGKHTKGIITAKPWYSPYSTSINWQKT